MEPSFPAAGLVRFRYDWCNNVVMPGEKMAVARLIAEYNHDRYFFCALSLALDTEIHTLANHDNRSGGHYAKEQ